MLGTGFVVLASTSPSLSKASSLLGHFRVSSDVSALTVSFADRCGERCIFVLPLNAANSFPFHAIPSMLLVLLSMDIFIGALCERERVVIVKDRCTLTLRSSMRAGLSSADLGRSDCLRATHTS